jgi:hypothetical protein
MEHYVTLFDANFLPQGLALAESLERHGGEHTLWVLCLDDRTREAVERIARPNVRTIALADVETPQLLAVKPGRTRAEYCWTLTPFTPRFVFEREPSARRVTYVDADMYFLRSPKPLFDEFDASGKAVLITEHAYDPEYDQSATSGRYCVQFITFSRAAGEPVRRWWEERCLEWCFNRFEQGRFGDQKYLDDWPSRFAPQVHVLAQTATLLAPWNARLFPHAGAVAWHFQGLRIEGERVCWYLGYEIPAAVERDIYAPYVKLLEAKCREIGGPVHQGPRKSAVRRMLGEAKAAMARGLGVSRLRHGKVTYLR